MGKKTKVEAQNMNRCSVFREVQILAEVLSLCRKEVVKRGQDAEEVDGASEPQAEQPCSSPSKV